MAGEVIPLSQEVIDAAWAGVEVTDAAYSAVIDAEAKYAAVELVDSFDLDGVVISKPAYDELGGAIRAAEFHRAFILNVVAPNLTDFETSPFSFPQEAAVSLGKAAVETTPETRFKAALETFLNPELPMSAGDQIDFTRELWGKLGYDMPNVTQAEREEIEAVLEANPGKRLFAAPLLELGALETVAEDARKITGKQFSQTESALWTPSKDSFYGKLLRNPGEAVKDGRDSYALRYKSPEDGELLTRAEFEAVLLKTGKGIAADSGTVWTFPVMDAAVRTERSRDTVAELHARVEPTVTREALVAKQLFHLANGAPNTEYEVDFANEGVYKLDKNGKAVSLVGATGVRWLPGCRQLYVSYWSADFRRGLFGVPGAASGL